MPPTDLALATLLAVLTAASRIPLRARLLPTWDAVQFALALREYDVVKHQPHPPGYILYVGAGRLVAPLLADRSQSFTWLAVLASALTVFGLYRLAWRLDGRPTAVVAALGLAASPLFWLYGLVGLPYAVEAALATGVAALAWTMGAPAGEDGGGVAGRRAVVRSALALGLAGGVRQSALLLLAPLWIAMASVAGGRLRRLARGGAVAALVAALWLVPMLWLSGGVRPYLATTLELYGSTVRPTTIVGLHAGWLGNLRSLGVALVLGLGLFLPALAGALARGMARPTRWGRREGFLAAWVGPPLAVYAGFHMGQLGYLLTVLPALYLVASRWLVTALGPRRPRLLTLLVAGAVLAHAAYFLGARPVDVPGPPAAGVLGPWRLAARPLYRFTFWANTADGLHEEEQVIRTYVAAIRDGFDPADTVIVTELGNPRSYPWFRHATYYLPEFRVVHLRLGRFSPGYLVSGLPSMAARPGPDVPLPEGTRRIVWMVDAWDPELPEPPGLRARRLEHGRWLYALDLGPRPVEHGGYRLARATAAAHAPGPGNGRGREGS